MIKTYDKHPGHPTASGDEDDDDDDNDENNFSSLSSLSLIEEDEDEYEGEDDDNVVFEGFQNDDVVRNFLILLLLMGGLGSFFSALSRANFTLSRVHTLV